MELLLGLTGPGPGCCFPRLQPGMAVASKTREPQQLAPVSFWGSQAADNPTSGSRRGAAVKCV